MSRVLVAAVAAALALPVLALAALVGGQEQSLAHATILNVPLRGYDPRDLLRGRYINGQLDWDWESPPAPAESTGSVDGAVCVLAGDAARPRVRFLEGWRKGDRVDPVCRLVIAGRGWKGAAGIAAPFVPTELDDGGTGGMKLFVPETRALELEQMMRDRPGSLSVDLAVRRDGSAAISALRVDGKALGR
ncbi:hypothetical protein BH11PSE3_BH11PSE3_16470 [soil metagenome]